MKKIMLLAVCLLVVVSSITSNIRAAIKPITQPSTYGQALITSILCLIDQLDPDDIKTLFKVDCKTGITIETLVQRASSLSSTQKIAIANLILAQAMSLSLDDTKALLMSAVENNMLEIRQNLSYFDWTHRLKPGILFTLINPFYMGTMNSIICILCSAMIAKKYSSFYSSIESCFGLTWKIMADFFQLDLKNLQESKLKDACIEQFEQYYEPIFLMHLAGILGQII